jgi:PRTRC genetic system protein C
MKIEHIPRIFKFNKEVLPEINPMMSAEQHMKHYSGIYHSLAICVVEYKGIEDGKAIYEFVEAPGERG